MKLKKVFFFPSPFFKISEGLTEEERLAKFAEAQKKRMARQREMIPKVNIPIPEKLEKQEAGLKLPALSRNDDGRNVNISACKIYAN